MFALRLFSGSFRLLLRNYRRIIKEGKKEEEMLLLLLFGVHQLKLPSHDFLSSFDRFFFNVFIVLNIIIVLVKTKLGIRFFQTF